MLDIKPFKKEDAELICKDAVDDSLHNNEEYWQKWAAINEVAGPGFTGYYKGELVGAAGINITDDGVGRVWLVMKSTAAKYKFSIIKTLRLMLPILMKNFNVKSVIADSRKGFIQSQRLLEHLKFIKMDVEDDTNYFYEYGG